MHGISPFFSHSSKGKASLDYKHKQKKPKLKRQNAGKNIDYQPLSSLASLPLSSSEASSSLRARSLDVSPLACRTSFRVGGNGSDFEDVCKELGFSGPDDFEIPAEEWQAMKMRSASDILPRKNQIFYFDNENARECSRSSVVSDGVCELADRLGGTVRVSIETTVDGEIKDIPEENNVLKPPSSLLSTNHEIVAVYPSRGVGINGVKPPPLVPPPLVALPVMDDSCSTLDLLKSLAPDADRSSLQVNLRSYERGEEEGESGKSDERIDSGLRGADFLSESCSFTTSVDDDNSSTTSNSISPNGRFRRIISYWEKGELLGSGSFGSVYEGIANDGFFFAVKEVSLLDQGDLGRQSIFQLEQEIALLSQFEHENIVQYYGTDKDDSKLYIFLELVTKGSLLKLYQKYKLRDSPVSSYTRQILHGLKYLHDRDVVHRDIKCANILVDAGGSVKLVDFGLAKATKLNDVKSCKGTALWMAPEVFNLQNQGYGLAADIWSLGCTVLEMLTRQLPYYPLEFMQAVYKIGNCIPPPVPDSLSSDARDFILQCLQVNPSSRPSAAKLLDHPFVKRPLPSSFGSPSLYNPGRSN